MYEYEKCFLIKSMTRIQLDLEANGYKLTGGERQKNYYFDHQDLRLFSNKQHLRLRYVYTPLRGKRWKFKIGEANFSEVKQSTTGIEDRKQDTMIFSEDHINYFKKVLEGVLVNSFQLMKDRQYYSVSKLIHFELDYNIMMKSPLLESCVEDISKVYLEPTLQICVEGEEKRDLEELNKVFNPIIESLNMNPNNYLKENYFSRYIAKIWNIGKITELMSYIPKWAIPQKEP